MSEEKKAKKANDRPFGLISDAFDMLELFAVCAVVLMTVFILCFRLSVVSGESMEQTLQNGDYLIVSTIYTPKRGDIVIAQNVSLNDLYSEPLVKRIIAVGGDVLDIDFSEDKMKITVNGEAIDESEYAYYYGYKVTTDWAQFPMTIPEGYVFLMGDNRNHSGDSRSSEVGLMDERCIVGKAIFRLLPLSNTGTLKGAD